MTDEELLTTLFPSPTGVNYYECFEIEGYMVKFNSKFPSPTGVNYYESKD